jgi:hypothetical protein
LLGIAWRAAKMQPPRLVSSVLGLPVTWLPPYRRFSEFQLLDLWQPGRLLRYLANVSLPSLPLAAPPFGPPWLNEWFFQPSSILQRPDHQGSYTTFPDEAWFFVNGILTNPAVAQLNAAHLASLFHRPITLLHNATAGLLVDLAQCAVGKQWRRITEPAVKVLPALYDALKRGDKQRVVVVAHSQGTLIMATVLDLLYALTERPVARRRGALGLAAGPAAPVVIPASDQPLHLEDFEPLTLAELGKLELYCFATCANQLRWFRAPARGRRAVPWLEHFGNEHDLVARLGMLAPDAARHGLQIDGEHWVRQGAWGHLLDEHYLYPIEQVQRPGRKRGGLGGSLPFRRQADDSAANAANAPRLYAYLNGGQPPMGAT